MSVVMPTYRRAHLIGLTIRSILEQTFRDFELLVRDDGRGGDGTEAAVRLAAAGDPRVFYHRNAENLAMPRNLNAGIEASRGEYIAVCHDHDLFAPTYLETLINLLDRYPSALYVHCGIELVDQSGDPLGTTFVNPWPELTRGRDWLKTMLSSFHCPVCALTLTRRAAHERYGLYHPAYGFIADVEMWMRLAEVGDVAYAAKSLVRTRTREENHDVNVDSFPVLSSVFSIHRRYLPRYYQGLPRVLRQFEFLARADIAVLRELLARLRRGRPLSFGRSAVRLRASAGPLGKRLSAVFP